MCEAGAPCAHFPIMSTQPSRKHDSDAPAIPDRLYFKIGDVARICDVETYVLRFWESQFPQLRPNKSGTGQRLYRRRDVELALEIKRLVHGEGYTLAGARQALEQGRRSVEPEPVPEPIPVGEDEMPHLEQIAATIGRARAELREIAALLSVPVAPPRRRPRLATMIAQTESLFPS